MSTNLEEALNEQILPWTEIEFRTKAYWVFRCDRDLLFVPTEKTTQHLWDCYRAAYTFGYNGIDTDKWKNFTITQTVGEIACQTINYPYIRLSI